VPAWLCALFVAACGPPSKPTATCDAGSCGPEVDAGPPAPVTLNELQDKIFSINCTTASCHSVDRAAGNLVLVTGQSFSQLVGVAADNPAAKGRGAVRVKPGSSELSFLWKKIVGPASDEGAQMPVGFTLTDAKLELIRRWIEGGVSCVPLDCAAIKKNCGMNDNGCGTQIDCGACPDVQQTCGGGGVSGVCG
jgi:hypothetical protein